MVERRTSGGLDAGADSVDEMADSCHCRALLARLTFLCLGETDLSYSKYRG